MRLWHKELISVLPNAQIKGQWNEINAIMGSINLHNSPRHGLVNYIMDYDISHFRKFCNLVLNEIYKRNDQGTLKYKPILSINKVEEFFKTKKWNGKNPDKLFAYHQDDEYLEICICNLKEKYRANLISKEEWAIIQNKFNK